MPNPHRPHARGGSAAAALLLLLALAGAAPAAPSPLTPELQKQVRAATFEVVLKKPEHETVTYEKPLPLELIPFQERNDKYWSIGTAFSIAPGTFVTAGHVMLAGIGSQFGVPAIRDGEGKVYPVDRVLKFSLHEDFVVFSVQGTPPAVPLPTRTTAAIDEPVLAVGNALGEGVVVRDGLMTSMTPEAQDGKWKWLRFSAAASPGNSGGPLLDAQGNVIGVVAAKSPGENLNYALPIELVLKGSEQRAVLERRESFGMPKLLEGTIVAEFKDSFPLPLPFAEFSQRVQAAILRYSREQQARLTASLADTLFPKGRSATVLANLYSSEDPAMLAQAEDGTWEVQGCPGEATDLPGDGRVWHCGHQGQFTLFRVQYPGNAFEEKHYRDSKEMFDLVLKNINLPRAVGPQPVRITSLGPAVRESAFRDRFGRQWQLRVYSLGYFDAYLHALALPTPDGYVGLLSFGPSGLEAVRAESLKFVADYLYLSYTGSIAQWQGFLARPELRPAVFEGMHFKFDPGKGLRLESPRLQLDSTGILAVTPQSVLTLEMTYLLDKGSLAWDVGGVVLHEERGRNTFMAAYRQAKPAEDASRERRDRWDHMLRRDADFNGRPGHDDALKAFWVRTVAGPDGLAGDGTRPLYELVYNTEHSLLPRDLEDMRARLGKSFRDLE